MSKLTKTQFNWFCDEVKHWTKFLGCLEWECRFKLEEDDEALASATWSAEDGIILFTLAARWNSKSDIPNSHSLSKVAFHEVCEVLLSDLNDLASVLFSRVKVNKEIHRVIRKLENTVFENEWQRRFPEGL